MKKIILLLFALTVSFGMQADELQDLLKWVKEFDCTSPRRTGHKEIDELYDLSDEYCKSVKAMVDSLPIYSLRSIVENGDTVAIVVVDQFNKPYNSFSAASQMALGSAYLARILATGVALAAKYAFVLPTLTRLVGSEGLKSIRMSKDFISHSKKIGKFTKETLPLIKGLYERRGNPIKRYQKAQASMSPDDGFVKTGFDHVPEFDPADMPTDEELDILLNEERKNRTT